MLSILIVNWNTRELLRACLNSIFQSPPSGEFEVIVVDNASSDGSADMVSESYPHAKLIASPTNTGYAKGNNLALSVAKGEWLLTLNPDTEVLAGSLDAALAAFEGPMGCLGAKQIGNDGEIQRSVRGFPTFLGVMGALTGLDRVFPSSKLGSYRLPAFDYSKLQVCDQPMGTFLLFRREALESLGPPRFDEDFPIFFNEVDLLYRMKKAGWECWYSPSVEIKHHGGESTKQVKKAMIWESHRSLARFFRKHHPGFMASIISIAASVGAFVRAKGYHAGFRP